MWKQGLKSRRMFFSNTHRKSLLILLLFLFQLFAFWFVFCYHLFVFCSCCFLRMKTLRRAQRNVVKFKFSSQPQNEGISLPHSVAAADMSFGNSMCMWYQLIIEFSYIKKKKSPNNSCLEDKCKSLSHVPLSAIPWTTARPAPLSMEFSRQEYWSG